MAFHQSPKRTDILSNLRDHGVQEQSLLMSFCFISNARPSGSVRNSEVREYSVLTIQSGMNVHAYNPSNMGGRSWKITTMLGQAWLT